MRTLTRRKNVTQANGSLISPTNAPSLISNEPALSKWSDRILLEAQHSVADANASAAAAHIRNASPPSDRAPCLALILYGSYGSLGIYIMCSSAKKEYSLLYYLICIVTLHNNSA